MGPPEEYAISSALQLARSMGVTYNESLILLSEITNFNKAYLIGHAEQTLTSEIFELFRSYLGRRVSGEPLSHLIGYREFFEDTFEVSSGVLDPRPDTEILVETCLDLIRKRAYRSILEIGAGTGCISISLAKSYPNIFVTSIDLSPKAVCTASENAYRLGCRNIRILLMHWNMIGQLNKKFDLIVSNPPYISSQDFFDLDNGVRNFEPKLALSPGPLGYESYIEILKGIYTVVSDRGRIVFEIGRGQRIDLLCAGRGFRQTFSLKDLRGVQRCVILQKIVEGYN